MHESRKNNGVPRQPMQGTPPQEKLTLVQRTRLAKGTPLASKADMDRETIERFRARQQRMQPPPSWPTIPSKPYGVHPSQVSQPPMVASPISQRPLVGTPGLPPKMTSNGLPIRNDYYSRKYLSARDRENMPAPTPFPSQPLRKNGGVVPHPNAPQEFHQPASYPTGYSPQKNQISPEEELKNIGAEEQNLARKWEATSDSLEKAHLEAQLGVLWKRSKELQFGLGWQPGGPVQPPKWGPVLKAVPRGLPGFWPAMPPPPEDKTKEIWVSPKDYFGMHTDGIHLEATIYGKREYLVFDFLVNSPSELGELIDVFQDLKVDEAFLIEYIEENGSNKIVKVTIGVDLNMALAVVVAEKGKVKPKPPKPPRKRLTPEDQIFLWGLFDLPQVGDEVDEDFMIKWLQNTEDFRTLIHKETRRYYRIERHTDFEIHNGEKYSYEKLKYFATKFVEGDESSTDRLARGTSED